MNVMVIGPRWSYKKHKS